MSQVLRLLYLDTEHVWRGGQEQLLSLMAGLLERGHAPMLAAPAGSPLSERARAVAIPTLDFSQRGEFSPGAARRISHLISRSGPFDVVHSNTPRTIAAAGLAVARSPNTCLRAASRRVIFPLKHPLSRLKYNWFTDLVITVCDSIKSQLIAGGVKPTLVHTVYEGVDLKALDQVPPADDLAGDSKLLVGAVGALTPEKGHRTLLRSWGRLAEAQPEADLLLVGDGTCREQLERQYREATIGNSVIFAGFRSDVVAVLKRLSVFVQPSLSEGLSSALLEAMGCGLPVVATAVGGNAELVVHGKTGFLVPPDDDRALAQALGNLIENPDLRRRMGEAGRKRIQESFTCERKVQSTEKLYLELLDSPPIG